MVRGSKEVRLVLEFVLQVEVDRLGRFEVIAAGLKGFEKVGRGIPEGRGEVGREVDPCILLLL